MFNMPGLSLCTDRDRLVFDYHVHDVQHALSKALIQPVVLGFAVAETKFLSLQGLL